MNILYIDLITGISGDMILSALIDAGLPLSLLKRNISKIITEDEFLIKAEQGGFNDIYGTRLIIKEKPFVERNYLSIKNSIQSSSLSNSVKSVSLNILSQLAKAESSVHNCSIEKVHFHEIGAVDTVIDIVGVATGLEYFNIKKIFVSEIPIGTGEIKSSHGIIPNPAPATIILLKDYILKPVGIKNEITTPTGAAIIKGVNAMQNGFDSFVLKKVGYGFGNLKFKDRPNCLRVLICEDTVVFSGNSVTEIEFNIDDMTGEEIGYFIELSKREDILDIQCIPSITKKNRPGYIFKILTYNCSDSLIKFIFSNTSTSGFRIIRKERVTMQKKIENIEKSLFQTKRLIEDKLGIRKQKLEFDSLKRIEQGKKK